MSTWVISNKKIVVIISNGNASKYTSSMNNTISSDSENFNFIFGTSHIGSTVTFTQNIGETEFSQKEVIELNKDLYLSGEDEYPTEKIDFSTYTNNKFTIFVKQTASEQVSLVAKTMPNRSSISAYFAKQTILQEEEPKETDYLFRADVTYYVPANLPVDEETLLYTLNENGEMVVVDKSNLSNNTVYFINMAYEKSMAIHGITLHYNDKVLKEGIKNYYILNNTIYTNISESEIVDFLTKFGIYVNINYETYEVELYWANVIFGQNSEYKLENGKLYKNSGSTTTAIPAGDYH